MIESREQVEESVERWRYALEGNETDCVCEGDSSGQRCYKN